MTVLDVKPKDPVIDYPTATSQQFQAFVSGGSAPIVANWAIDNGPLGSIDGTGLFKASGNLGGTGTVTATSGKASGSTSVSVILHMQENPGNVSAGDQAKLLGGGNADAGFKWMYPYDQTVFPRGLTAPVLQFAGTAPSAFYVHIKSKFMDYQGFFAGTNPARITLPAATWKTISQSVQANDPVAAEVTKLAGGVVTGPTKETWTIAPGQMRGTVYYWSNNLGRVLRLKPGAAAPDDFARPRRASRGAAPATPSRPTARRSSSAVTRGDVRPSNLKGIQQDDALRESGARGRCRRSRRTGNTWSRTRSPLPGPPGGADGLWLTSRRHARAAQRARRLPLGMPAFAPDGTKLAYRGEGAA